MKTFSLLLEGNDVDTGKYEYFPYLDKYLLDPKITNEAVLSLRRGTGLMLDAEDYIYSRNCVGHDEENQIAIRSAYKAFEIFRKTSSRARSKIFRDMYDQLLKKKEEFLDILVIEGHPRKLAEWEFEGMMIGSDPETIDFYFSNIRREVGRDSSEIVYWSRKPDGVVGLIPPGNASASNSYNAILAFITGNTVIVKPPLKMSASTIFLWKEVVWKTLMANGAPPGTVNIITGNSQKILNAWMESPLVSDVIYFGKSKKGLELGKQIYGVGKKPILELSGNDIFMTWKDADIEGASKSLLDCFMGSTQICMVPKIALIHASIYDKFVESFLGKVKALKFGMPSDKETIFSPVGTIPEFYEFLEDALSKGAKMIHGGKRVDHNGQPCEKGVYLEPTLLEVNDTADFKSMTCCKEEIFFPLLPLVRVSGTDEEIFSKMTDIAGGHQYGLRMSLWISNDRYLRKFARALDNTGYFRINTRHIGFSKFLSTHGGTRRSGGPFGEMNYFWHKTSHLQGICRRPTVIEKVVGL